LRRRRKLLTPPAGASGHAHRPSDWVSARHPGQSASDIFLGFLIWLLGRFACGPCPAQQSLCFARLGLGFGLVATIQRLCLGTAPRTASRKIRRPHSAGNLRHSRCCTRRGARVRVSLGQRPSFRSAGGFIVRRSFSRALRLSTSLRQEPACLGESTPSMWVSNRGRIGSPWKHARRNVFAGSINHTISPSGKNGLVGGTREADPRVEYFSRSLRRNRSRGRLARAEQSKSAPDNHKSRVPR